MAAATRAIFPETPRPRSQPSTSTRSNVPWWPATAWEGRLRSGSRPTIPTGSAPLVLAAPAANLASLEAMDRWLTLPVVGPLTSAASLTGLGLALSARPGAPEHRPRVQARGCLPEGVGPGAAHVLGAARLQHRAARPAA